MITRKEMYAESRRARIKTGMVQHKCKCGCYTKGRHKVWCDSLEAKEIKKKKVKV